MIGIVLKDGQTVNINATNVEWCENSRTIKLVNSNDRDIVARINMDNVVGWVNTDYTEGGIKYNI